MTRFSVSRSDLGTRFALLLLVAAFIAVPAMFILLGQYAYPSADDFCMATGVRDIGFSRHLWNHYFEWSGRYAGNAYYAAYPLLFGLFEGYGLIAFILIAGLFGATVFFLSSLFRLSWRNPLVLFAGLGLLCLYLTGLRHSASSLYWMAGALSYQTSGIFLLLAAGLVLRLYDSDENGRGRSIYIALLVVVIVLGMGTNEINLIVMTALMLMVYIHAFFTGREKRLWFRLLLLTLACLALVYLAPGNAVRESTFPLRHDWMRSIDGSLRMGSWTILAWMGVPAFIVGSLLIPIAAQALSRQSPRQFRISAGWLVVLSVATFSAPLVLQFPAWWAMGGWPPPRSVDAIYFVFLMGWSLLIGALALRFLPPNLLFQADGDKTAVTRTALLVLVIAFALALAINGRLNRAWNDLTTLARPFHDHMLQRHAIIAEAKRRGEVSVLLPAYSGSAPRSVYFNDIRPDWRDWRNTCYAQYFGLRAVQLTRPSSKGKKDDE